MRRASHRPRILLAHDASRPARRALPPHAAPFPAPSPVHFARRAVCSAPHRAPPPNPLAHDAPLPHGAPGPCSFCSACSAPRSHCPRTPSLMTCRTAPRSPLVPALFAPRAVRRTSHPLAHDAPLAARRGLPPHGAPVPRAVHRCLRCMHRAPHAIRAASERRASHRHSCHTPPALCDPLTPTTFISSVFMAAGATRRPSRSCSPRVVYPCTCPSELRAALFRFSPREGKYGFVLVT